MSDTTAPTEVANSKPAQQPKEKKAPAAKKEKADSHKIDVSKLEKPEYVAHRIKLWEEVKKKQAEDNSAQPEKKITITLPDGKTVEGVAGKTTPFDVAMGISKGLAENSVVAKVNDELYDLARPLQADCNLALFKFDSPEGKKVFWAF